MVGPLKCSDGAFLPDAVEMSDTDGGPATFVKRLHPKHPLHVFSNDLARLCEPRS